MRKENAFLNLFLLLSMVFLTACMSIRYSYNGVLYTTSGEALDAQRKDNELIISKITETKKPIGGTAVVIIPSIAYAEKYFFDWKGQELPKYLKEKATKHNATTVVYAIKLRGEVLERYRTFDRITIKESDDPENASFTDDIAVICIKRDGKAKWFIKRKNNPQILKEVEEISTALPPVQRMMLWLEKVENLAKE